MAVKVKLPTQLRAAAGGDGEVSVEGSTVGDALDALYAVHPDLKERIADEDGTLRRFVNVYLDGDDIRFGEGLATPVKDGAQLQILPAVAGG
ncbi:MAG: MoaD family protein [Solirubrobacterales bacterium]|nr:MoaD family protein [Solirubrobacterales bacterium]